MDARQRNILIAVVVVILGAAVALVVAVLGGSGDDGVEATSTTSGSTSSSTSTAVAPVETSTTTTLPVGDLDLAVYPNVAGGARFDDPQELVRAFATEVMGFDTNVVVGPLAQGDSRSGEIEIHPPASAAITTVAVRQISDSTWVVVTATTGSIHLGTPVAATRISSPQPLLGSAAAFEGHVDVMLYADGEDVPVATTFVTGRGDGVLGDFTGSLKFTAPAGATRGILVLTSANADDGTTVAAIAVRVRF